jgi:hypothetical protein
MRLKWLNNPSGKHQTPYDLGLCKFNPEAKIAAKAWTRISRHSRTTTTGILARACVHATLRFFLYPGNGVTVFTKGEAMFNAH